MGEVGRFHTIFSTFYCMRLAPRRTLMGAVDKARGAGTRLPYPLMSPISFVVFGIVSPSECLSRRRTLQPRAGETELQRTGAWRPRGNKQILPTFATYLPRISDFLHCFCRHSY